MESAQNKLKKLSPLWIILGVIVLLVIWGISTNNGLVQKDQNVKTQFSNIDTQLKRRSDLIPNLVATVQGYAQHEEEIFTKIAEARSQLLNASGVQELAQADSALNSALGRLLAIQENYPDLKANQNFIQLQDELAGTENRISVARKDYNDAARDYNVSIKSFPNSIFAGILGFKEADYFEATAEDRENPQVQF